jgi:branched-chain amino acid transport system permease protein
MFRLVAISGLYVTLAVSLNLINGITGQFSIGHAAFYQVGAYTTVYLSNHAFKTQGLDAQGWLLLMVIVGGLAAGITGVIVGLPSLRLRGDYLAIVTLGFGEIIRIICQNQKELGEAYGMKLTYGMTQADKVLDPANMVWMIWLLAIVCIAVCRNLLKNAQGLAFLAVREDEVASSAMGVNTTRIKVAAFVIGSMFAGMAGALFAHHETFISPAMFNMELSFMVLTMVVLGGTGSITGSVVAAIGLYLIPEWIRTLKGADNQVLTFPAPAVVGMLFGIGAFVVGARMVRDKYHGSPRIKALLYVGAVVGAFLIGLILAFPFGAIPQLRTQSFDANQLRMVIFSIVLIVMMLLRPQGLFGQREFSLDRLLPKALTGGDR